MKPLLLLLIACNTTEYIPESPPESESQTPSSGDPKNAEEHISVHLDFPERAAQYIEVEMVVPTYGRERLELAMANWTPGSYLIRDYSRHVERITAYDGEGKSLSIQKTTKNRWQVEAKSSAVVQVRYHLFANELNVRGNWVESDFAVLNGAPTFLYDPEHTDTNVQITVDLPAEWPDVHTALPKVGEAYIAEDLDTLIDTPWLLGDTAQYSFIVDGIAHKFINWGEQEVWDGTKSAEDVETLVRKQIKFWGNIPYPHYLFLNVLSGSRGGLEHKNSTLMMSQRWNTHEREDYLDWLGLVSHEFFHTWNVKRLRPEPLGPFNYESENYTRSLWISEGITSYYDDLLLVRAGLMNEDEYLSRLSKQIQRFQDKPGRHIRSLEEVSFDAWIKHYKKDANSLNTAVSYYSKGAVVGWLLDMEIRRASLGARSLDDVMRAASARFSGTRGFSPEEFQSIAEESAGVSLHSFFDAFVRGTEELYYDTALDWLGLSFGDAGEALPWLGIELEGGTGKRIIRSIERDSPVFESPLIVGDELIAIDGFRIQSGSLDPRLKQLKDRKSLRILASRRGTIFETELQPKSKQAPSWTLRAATQSTKTQKKNRAHWLNGTLP